MASFLNKNQTLQLAEPDFYQSTNLLSRITAVYQESDSDDEGGLIRAQPMTASATSVGVPMRFMACNAEMKL